MEQVTDKAGKAVAAAAVAHMKQQMAETLNPWASSKASTHPPTVTKSVAPPPPKPVQQPISVENNLTNPFAMPRAPPSPDLDNPFLELNGRN